MKLRKYKKASNALKAAKKLISSKKHWTQSELAVNAEGEKCSTKSKHAQAFCALGAVKHVNGPAERSAIAFLREAARKSMGSIWDNPYKKTYNSPIFAVNDDRGHKDTMRMFSKAIKMAKKAGN